MMDLGLLVRFPFPDQTGPAVVAQVDSAPRHMNEAVVRDLPPAHQRYDEPVGQRAQLLGKVKGERRPSGPRAMEEPHLEVQADTLGRTDALGYQQAVAESEHGVDGVSGWTPSPGGELESARRDRLADGAEVDPGGIALDAPDMVCRVGAGQPSDPLPDLRPAIGEPFRISRVRFVPRPPLDDLPAVLQLRRDNRLRQLERPVLVGGRLEQRRAQVHVAAGHAVDHEADGPTRVECGHSHAATHTRIQRLRGDLGPAEHDDGIDPFERHPLAAVRRGHEQRPPAMLHAGSMAPHVHRAQQAHSNTTWAKCRVTLRGVLVSSGRQ